MLKTGDQGCVAMGLSRQGSVAVGISGNRALYVVTIDARRNTIIADTEGPLKKRTRNATLGS